MNKNKLFFANSESKTTKVAGASQSVSNVTSDTITLEQVLSKAGCISEALKEDGWVQADAGYSKQIDYNEYFGLYIRRCNLKDLYEQKQGKQVDSVYTLESETETDSDNKNGTGTLVKDNYCLPRMSTFEIYESLKAIRTDKESIVIAMDSEWYYPNGRYGDREVLSWHFACR